MRRLVLGDVHGNIKALEQVLNRCRFDPTSDLLIQIGDLVDGWDYSFDVVEMIRDIPNKILIRGNHDKWFLEFLHRNHSNIDDWNANGGQSTIRSYHNAKSANYLYDEHRALFESQLDYHLTDDNILFIHGGWKYKLGFPEGAMIYHYSDHREAYWNRSLLQDGVMAASKGGKYNDQVFNGTKMFKEVYIGHTALNSDKPMQFCNLWNVDTGAGWHGVLSIMDIDTKEYWTSDDCQTLYPNEKGRK